MSQARPLRAPRSLSPVIAMTGASARASWISRVQAGMPAMLTATMQGLNSLSNLAIAWFLVRRIGVAGFGYYSAYFILTSNAVAISGAFVINPLNSVASKLSERRQAEFVQSAGLSQLLLAAALVVAGVAASLVALIGGWPAMPVVAVFLYVIGMSCGEFWRRIRFFRRQIGEVLVFDLGRYALLAAVLVALPWLIPHPGATAYTLAIAATYLVAIAVHWPFAARPRRVPFDRRRLLAQMRRLARSGRWLAGVAFLKFADGGAVLFLSFVVLGAYEAGLLRLAQTIVGLTMPAMQTLEHTVPRLLGEKIREFGMSGAKRFYRKLAIGVVAGFAALYAAIVALSPVALRVMRIPVDREGILLVAGFSLVYLLTITLTLIEFQVRARERAHIVTLSLTVSACVTMMLAYPSLRYFGAVGAVVAIVCTRSLSIAICSWAARRSEREIRQ